MFSPRQSASFIESKIVSIVASACFCVTPRLTTRMLMRSDLSICTPAGMAAPFGEAASGRKNPSPRFRNQQGIRGDAMVTRQALARSGAAGRRSRRIRARWRGLRALAGAPAALALAERPEGRPGEPLRCLVLDPAHDRRHEAGVPRERRLLPRERTPDVEERDLLERPRRDEPAL